MSKPHKFVNERKPIKRQHKQVEKSKSVREQIIEEWKKEKEVGAIAQLLNVNKQFVAKVIHLYKQEQATRGKPKKEKFALGLSLEKEKEEKAVTEDRGEKETFGGTAKEVFDDVLGKEAHL